MLARWRAVGGEIRLEIESEEIGEEFETMRYEHILERCAVSQGFTGKVHGIRPVRATPHRE